MIDLRTGDGVAGLAELTPQSVDLVFADLPSGQTQAPFDVPLDLERFWAAVRSAVKPRAAVVLMASHLRFAADILASNRAHFRFDLVWTKNKASGFLNAKRMPLRAHEHLLVFSREPARYFPQKRDTGRPMHAATQTGHGHNYGAKTRKVHTSAGTTLRHPTSVLAVPVVNNDDPNRTHPQQKPEALAAWVVSSFTLPGDLVVDPCAGSGSSGRAAAALGRRWIGWEIAS